MNKEDLHIIQVGNVLVSPDIITEKFCCDLDKCHGICCVEGDAGAPISMDEIAETETALDVVWPDLKASVDEEGDLVTSIVGGKDCVFTYDHEGCCLCALEKAYRGGKTQFKKPISCALYPIRAKEFSGGLVGINYHKWRICRDAVVKGEALNLPVYKFLKAPLIDRFGEDWYKELCQAAEEIEALLDETKKNE